MRAIILTLVASLILAASGAASGNTIPKSQWWAMKDVRALIKTNPFIKFHGRQKMIGHYVCIGVGRGSLEKGYGRTWSQFDCVLHVSDLANATTTKLAARLRVLPGGHSAVWLGMSETG